MFNIVFVTKTWRLYLVLGNRTLFVDDSRDKGQMIKLRDSFIR
jgi:hypothetical protein